MLYKDVILQWGGCNIATGGSNITDCSEGFLPWVGWTALAYHSQHGKMAYAGQLNKTGTAGHHIIISVVFGVP